MLSRKYHNTLYVSGIIVVAFSFWGVIRSIAYLFLSSDSSLSDYKEMGEFKYAILIFALIIVIAADFLLRFYVGRCAIIEGHGKKRSIIYVVLAVLMVFSTVGCIILAIDTFNETDAKASTIISIVVDTTNAINMCELIYSAIRVKRIHKESA